MSTLSTVSRNRTLSDSSGHRVLNGPQERVPQGGHGNRGSADSTVVPRGTRDSRFIKYVLTSALQSTKSKEGCGAPGTPAIRGHELLRYLNNINIEAPQAFVASITGRAGRGWDGAVLKRYRAGVLVLGAPIKWTHRMTRVYRGDVHTVGYLRARYRSARALGPDRSNRDAHR